MIVTKELVVKNKKIQAITFQVEELERPTKLLEEKPLKEILQKFAKRIEAHSKVECDLVSNGFHSFLYGMYQAYAEHRPFVMSPDMIWLLIAQGFSQHVNFSRQTKHEVFPHLNEKQTIAVRTTVQLGDPDGNWEETTQAFSEEIAKHIGPQLVDALKADFSTTGLNERVASEITLMDAMKSYFEYLVFMCVCGIPEITLEGTTEDWEKMQQKLTHLRKYKLDWWIDKLDPILEEFVLASRGKVDQDFWQNMFRVHSKQEYGNPKYIDGWIRHFYPYDREGNRIDLKNITGLSVERIFDELPKEIACVDFKYLIVNNEGAILETHPMEYWAGFVGLQQDKKTMAIRPEIGWFVSHKEAETRQEGRHKNDGDDMESRTYYNLDAFPSELFQNDKKWLFIRLHFKDQIIFPEDITSLSIMDLNVIGKISEVDKATLKELFLQSKIRRLGINEEYFDKEEEEDEGDYSEY